jgi:hypothetical protein
VRTREVDARVLAAAAAVRADAEWVKARYGVPYALLIAPGCWAPRAARPRREGGRGPKKELGLKGVTVLQAPATGAWGRGYHRRGITPCAEDPCLRPLLQGPEKAPGLTAIPPVPRAPEVARAAPRS